MTTETNSRLFDSEREDTDKSLVAEREKATRSLDTASAKSQDQTDEIVKDERSIADQQTAASRAHYDLVEKSERGKPASLSSKAQLTEERRKTDLATDLERSRVDGALLAEREAASKLVAKVLEQERITTDRNLLAERNTTDAEHVSSSARLKAEVAEHKKTLGTLTSREEFLAIVSHDLKNPIGAISSYADLILDGSGDTQLGPDTLKFVRAIKRNADVSLRLISDLLDLERISQDKLEMKFAKCDAHELVKDVLEIFAPRANEKGVDLGIGARFEHAELDGDHDRILQVLSNLVGNALKYTAAGGSITVETIDGGSTVDFVVKDTGTGIPKEKQSQIFERFAQLKSSDRTGLGLGLYIAKTIVEAHRGEISVDSQIGGGSAFRVSLPKLASSIRRVAFEIVENPAGELIADLSGPDQKIQMQCAPDAKAP